MRCRGNQGRKAQSVNTPRARYDQHPHPNPLPPTRRSVFITTDAGAVFTIEAQFADAAAERLERFIPHWALAHVRAGDYWVVTARFAETARLVLLVTCGSVLRLWSPSYPAALARLARFGRGSTVPADLP